MQGLFSHFTAAILIAHTLLGCCWHHEHRCGQAHDSIVALTPADCTADHADAADHHAPPGHRHHGPHDCLGGMCVYLAAGQTRVASLPVDLAPAVGVTACLPDPTTLNPTPEISRVWAGDLCLPVRLHMAHQVLLI